MALRARGPAVLLALLLVAALAMPSTARAAGDTAYNLPAQSGERALLAFAQQARIELLFSYDDLRRVRTNPLVGRFSTQEALDVLLRDTGFAARRAGETRWVVTPTAPPGGTIKGRIRTPDGSPARRVRVAVAATNLAVSTDDDGAFLFSPIPPGSYVLFVQALHCRPLQIIDVRVVAGRTTVLPSHALQHADDPTRMEPFVVHGRASHLSPLDHSDAPFEPRRAAGNLDLARTESDALPYMIFNRAQISRSGVVNLNEFLQRELIDSSAGVLPPEQIGSEQSFLAGSSNLSLRGFSQEETVILVNGRRLPEILISNPAYDVRPPDVNFIPLSLVQRVEILPVSAAALYSGNAVGGVINIVLRPDVDARASEVTTTYTNALGGYDAPQSSLSLLHAESLRDGSVRIRLNASITRVAPATEAELGFRQRRLTSPPGLGAPAFGATPNIRSVDGSPLSGRGDSPIASVAPGTAGVPSASAIRSGVRNLAFFDSPGSYSTALQSLDFPYGRAQERSTCFGSVVYDARPWFQLALDATYTRTVVHRGLDVLSADLTLPSGSVFNPFGQDVKVSLLETAPELGENYGEARLESGSFVLGALLRATADWRIAADAQYSRSLVRYRGLWGADEARWQNLIAGDLYNPLRDTQRFGPPPEFYDQVLIYRKARGHFATLGDYSTLDLALRATNESLPLPTGNGVLNVGLDYRQNHLAKYADERRYADGTLFEEPTRWDARTLTRYSAFAELQGELIPARRQLAWLKRVEADAAVRYVAANNARESNFAPTIASKLTLPGGFALRGSFTASTRFPTPHMSRLSAVPSGGDGSIPVNRQRIKDPRRHDEEYDVVVNEVLVPDLDAESAATQTVGLIFQGGTAHRFRAALDFVDTRKVNELAFINQDMAIAHEDLWPERVQRAAPGTGESAGRILSVTTSRANLADRHSQDWTTSIDYRWNACLGGTLEMYARALYFQRYDVRTLPTSPKVDQLNAPDGIFPLLKYRANFGAAWSNQAYAFGADGHYFHSRLLPVGEWQAQGGNRIRPYWQFDAFAQADVARWLPGYNSRYSLRLQLRVNNVFGSGFPKYVNDDYRTGVQPYDDWRGRLYSVSLTASF